MHWEYYQKPDNIAAPDPNLTLHLYAQYCSINTSVADFKDCKVAYQEDIVRICSPNAWADMFHVLQAASILQMSIISVHPEFPVTRYNEHARQIKSCYNVTVWPHVGQYNMSAAIMWSHSNHKATGGPNHFVTIVR